MCACVSFFVNDFSRRGSFGSGWLRLGRLESIPIELGNPGSKLGELGAGNGTLAKLCTLTFANDDDGDDNRARLCKNEAGLVMSGQGEAIN